MKNFKAIPVLAVLIIVMPVVNGQKSASPEAGKIIETIISKTGVPALRNTVDVIKEGSPDTRVTGIVTTMFATMEVLKQAVEKNCNLIVVHEPLYYNHLDETAQFKNDPVFLTKKKFINEHHLVIWRFHDYIHSMKPDGIEMGMVEKLGWEKYELNGRPDRFIIPETTLNELLKSLKKTFPKNSFYVIGDPGLKVSKISFAPGAPGSMSHIARLEDPETDVLLAGEAQQWETYEYMRDAVSQGRKKAVVFLGHISSEEAGMDYCAKWLKTFIKDVPVYYLESGPSFWSY